MTSEDNFERYGQMEWHKAIANRIDGLVQDYSNSGALAMELLQSCTKPSNNEPYHKWIYALLNRYSFSYRDEGIVILAGFFAGFTGWCLSTTSSVSGGGSHVGMTTFSFQWITTELFFMKSHIYLKFYPFLWTYCDKIVFSYFMCTLSQTLFLSTPSYLGVLDMCLILSLYLHVLSLSVGFRYHYLWYCLYVYLLIICMYYFICGFYVSLSFDIVYMYIYLCIYLLKVGD